MTNDEKNEIIMTGIAIHQYDWRKLVKYCEARGVSRDDAISKHTEIVGMVNAMSGGVNEAGSCLLYGLYLLPLLPFVFIGWLFWHLHGAALVEAWVRVNGG